MLIEEKSFVVDSLVAVLIFIGELLDEVLVVDVVADVAPDLINIVLEVYSVDPLDSVLPAVLEDAVDPLESLLSAVLEVNAEDWIDNVLPAVMEVDGVDALVVLPPVLEVDAVDAVVVLPAVLALVDELLCKVLKIVVINSSVGSVTMVSDDNELLASELRDEKLLDEMLLLVDVLPGNDKFPNSEKVNEGRVKLKDGSVSFNLSFSGIISSIAAVVLLSPVVNVEVMLELVEIAKVLDVDAFCLVLLLAF